MMFVKESTAIVLDFGKFMHQRYFPDKTKRKFDVALDFIKTFLTQKILFNKYHDVSLLLMGYNDGDDGDLMPARRMGKVDVCFIKMLEDIRTANASILSGGDIFKAINYVTDQFGGNTYRKREQIKKIFLFTDGNGRSEYDDCDVKELARKVKSRNIKINFIALDFCEEETDSDTEDAEDDEIVEQRQQTPAQNRNQRLLEAFCLIAEARIFPSLIATSLQKQFRTRSVKAIAKFWGVFEISEGLKIPVVTYGKVVEEKFPTAKKFSLLTGKDKSLTQGKVVYIRESYLHDDITQNPIEQEHKIKGYFYGKQLVPIPEVLTDKLKYTSAKCFQLLCFAEKKSIPRHYFMHTVDMVLPRSDQYHQKAFAALVRALYELDKVAIVRYCYRDNLSPKLACLQPHIAANYECLWLNILPTAEDIRDFQFTALKDATPEQLKIVGEFIDDLDLMKCGDEKEEALKCSSTYNPTLHYYYQCLAHRALNESDKLVPLDPAIASYVRPDKKMFDKARGSIEKIEKNFTFKEFPRKDKPKSKLFWSQILTEAARKMEETGRTKVYTIPCNIEKDKIIEIDKDITRNISSANPIVDFRKMINERTEDLTNSAIEQMIQLIERLIEETFQGNMYDKALECLQELRKGCIQEDEAPAFNDFLGLMKERHCDGKHEKFWQKVISHGITMIDSNEAASSSISPEEAKRFLLEEDSQVQNKFEEEHNDLLAEIE